MTTFDIGHINDIGPGERLLVNVNRRSIGIFNIEGTLFALKNACIHDQAPVCLGEVGGTFMPSAPDEYVRGLEGQVLRCPWHGWEFDIKTGQALFDPDTRLKTYPVLIEDGRIIIEIGGK